MLFVVFIIDGVAHRTKRHGGMEKNRLLTVHLLLKYRYHIPRLGVDEIRDYSQTLCASSVKLALEKLRTDISPTIADEMLTDEKIREITGYVLASDRKFKPGDGRAFYKALKARTGFSSVRFDCCVNSCVSYSKYPNDDKCPRCQTPRWTDAEKKVPGKTHVYFPIRHRLLLWYTSKFMSRLLQ